MLIETLKRNIDNDISINNYCLLYEFSRQYFLNNNAFFCAYMKKLKYKLLIIKLIDVNLAII